MNENLEPDTWIEIYSLISKNPGISLSRLAATIDIKISLLEKYIFSMEEKGRITGLHEEGYIKYYVSKPKTAVSQEMRSQETRTRIYGLIAENPGLHLSKIADTLNMSIALAEYHLLRMEKNEVVTSGRDKKGYHKRFYIKDMNVTSGEKKILSLLRHEPLLKIVLLLVKESSLRHKEILKMLDLAPSTLSYHLNKLVQNEIIDVSSYGKEKGYRLKNEKEIIRIIHRYKLDRLVESFMDTWIDFNLQGHSKKNPNSIQ